MKDPNTTNAKLTEKVDTFSWETTYRGLGQSQSGQEQVEELLRENKDKYRRLVDTTADWIWAIDLEGCHTYSNPAIYQLLGYQVSEVIGSSTFPPMPPEDEQPIREMIKHCIEQRVGWQNFSIRRFHKDGSIRSFESTASPIVNAEGRVAGFCGINRDITEITERKRSEAALQQARDEQEKLAADRAEELMRVNEELRAEITERDNAEKQLQHTLDSFKKTIDTTLQVMGSAVETRDPYMTGHQVRSTVLALSIAGMMGLPQDKIDGIRMAGSVHDIGKLSIPAEILSKPTKLSDIEYSLIKEHSRKGYEILKNVESPCALAEIVYQNHERIDGSGYPRNLKGEDILIEARILSVADVVEAMASHRPYRPGLGIDAALNEIEKHRGTLYDDAVAAACLRLFREKGFKLEGTWL